MPSLRFLGLLGRHSFIVGFAILLSLVVLRSIVQMPLDARPITERAISVR